jgi:hypothetical protein
MIEAERQKLTKSRERADLARLRFANAFEALLKRAAPERLGADALGAAGNQFETVLRDLRKRMRYWPLAIGALLIGLLTILFWRPAKKFGRFAFRLATLAWTTRNIWRAGK